VNIVLDVFHACDTTRNLGGFIRLLRGRGRASQRYYAIGGGDTDMGGTDVLGGKQVRLYFGCDRRIIDVRSCFFPSTGATRQGQYQDTHEHPTSSKYILHRSLLLGW
jgi:hypothetical protein